MKKALLLIAILIGSFSLATYAQTTYVPDDIFEQVLIDHGYDDVLDDYVLTANIINVNILFVENYGIADLTGIEDFLALTNLYCQNNQLTELNVSQNTLLSELVCYNNNLIALDVSENPDLWLLDCSSNEIMTLDVSSSPNIGWLFVHNNQLTELNVSQNTALTELACDNNNLTTLDISQNPDLSFLVCSFNAITSLDTSLNPLLSFFHCDNNQLTALNVASGNNHHGTELYAVNNPDLYCIQIDEGYVPNTSEWFIDSQTQYASDCVSKTYIPDDIFEQALIDQGYDTVLDDYVYTSNINTIENLYVDDSGITDLTGIEDFLALKNLRCQNNQLTSLNITQNTLLESVWCQNNPLTSLDVTQNTNLQVLWCENNQLTSLDVSNNPELFELICKTNQLTSLDVSQNIALDQLQCANNQLTTLDLTQNTVLNQLWAYSNQLTSINLPQGTNLWSIWIQYNQLTELNISPYPILNSVRCYNNQLISLNLANGNNEDLNNMDATNNPDLFCIKIDEGHNNFIGWHKDDQAEYSANCFYDHVFIPDDNFEQELINLGYDDVLDNSVLRGNISGVTELNLNGLNISDLTGIEDFAALSVLMCQNNLLAELDLSSNAALTILNCDSNQLVGLNVANGSNTSFTSVSAVNNTNLYCIQIDENFVPDTNWLKDGQTQYSPDCSDVTYIPDNNFEQGLINLGYDTVLDDQVLTSIIKEVEILYINELGISDLSGIENFTALSRLSCNKNQLTALDVSQNTALTGLQCAANQLTVLDLSQNTALTSLRCNSNLLTTLDVSQNPNLSRLFCQDNLLSSLNISNGNNPDFSWVVIENNPFLYCAQIDDGFIPGSNWIKDYKAEWSVYCALGIPESGLDEIVLYPNPTSGVVNIKNIRHSAVIEIFDISGRHVMSPKDVDQVDMSQFDTGLYFIKISDKVQSQTFKIIKN